MISDHNLNVTLVDSSEQMLQASKDKLGTDKRFSFSLSDAEAFPFFDNSFDKIICLHMIYHTKHIDKALDEIGRVLKPKGTLYISTVGENDMKGFSELLIDFDYRIEFGKSRVAARFNRSKGEELLSERFQHCESCYYVNKLLIIDKILLLE